VLTDRGFCKPGGVETLHRQGAAVMGRLNSSTLPLWDQAGERFGLLAQVTQLKQTGDERKCAVWVQGTKERDRASGLSPVWRARRRGGGGSGFPLYER